MKDGVCIFLNNIQPTLPSKVSLVHHLSGRSSGFGHQTYSSHLPIHFMNSGYYFPIRRIIKNKLRSKTIVIFVAHYSSGAATDLHRFPYYPFRAPYGSI